MSLAIKEFSEIPSSHKKYFMFTVISFFLGGIAMATLGVGMMSLCISSGIYFFIKGSNANTCAENTYEDHLDTIDVNTLINSTQSPEISGESKALIIKHLNQKHAGWSFK